MPNNKGGYNITKKYVTQKLIFKLNSSRIRRAKWDLQLSIAEAIKNEELVPLSDSTVLRFIDNINSVNNDEVNNKIGLIQNEIKQTKKQPASIQNRSRISQLYKNLNDLQFRADYICVVIDKISDYYNLNKGFKINGTSYKRLLGTTGGVKNSTIVFVSEISQSNNIIYQELKRRLNNGRDKTVNIVPAKFEAYQSLACSSSTPVDLPQGILVVNDCITKFKSDYINIDDTGVAEPVLTFVKDGGIELIDSDGYGLMLPSLAKRWAENMGVSYLPSGCCIRNSWCKGMTFTFDFVDFAKNIARQETVIDVWGNAHCIDDIDLILTTSMLKLWDSYSSIEDYLQNFQQNGYTFSITKLCPESLENQRNLNYQFLQSYNLDDNQIKELLQPTINEIRDIFGGDINKTILFLKGMFVNEDNINSIECDFIKALMVDDRMINDPFVQSKIHQMIKKRINEAKIGVLQVAGNYSIVSGDPYSLCQSVFNLEVTGLLKAGQFYSKYWLDRDVLKVVCFRAPMTCHNNIRTLNIVNNKTMSYWYRYMNTVTIFNSWDMTAHALNGCDKDSDTVMTTNCSVLLKNTKNLPAIQCIQRKAEKKIISEEDLIKANIDSFGEAIGSTTNHITAMFDIQSQFDEGSIEYQTLDYRIMCGQLYQQNEIDKAKGIIAQPIPKEWYNKLSNKIKQTDDIEKIKRKEFNLKIIADKKPYFMNYIYPQQMSGYKKYINTTNKKTLMEFRVTMQELLDKPNKTKKEKEFIEWYYLKMPVGINGCTVNKICWEVENVFDGYLNKIKKPNCFDYSILKCDIKYSKKNYNDILNLYKEYNKIQQDYKIKIKKDRLCPSEATAFRNILKQNFKYKCLAICSNEEKLCNIVLDICYTKQHSKQFAWDVCGDVIINNLLKKNNNIIKFLVKDDFGNTEYKGEKFSTQFKVIGGYE